MKAAARLELTEGPTFIIDGPMDRDTVPELRKKSFKLLRRHRTDSLTVDLSHVTHLDTSGLALLVEWCRALQGNGGRLRLAGFNEEIKSKIHLARLDLLLESCAHRGSNQKVT